MENKPISIIVEEARKQIADSVNSLHLSPTILEWILKDLYQEAQQAHQLEYQSDMQKYNKQLNTGQQLNNDNK